MASANYDAKNQRWVLLWKLPTEKGYSYGRKRISDKTYPSMGAREQRRVKKQMEAQAEALEAAAKDEENNAPVATPAWQDLKKIQKVCKSEAEKGVKDARSIVHKFAKWMEDNHPAMMLADIDATTMAEYTAYLMRSIGMATNTAKQHLRRIKWVLTRKGNQPAWTIKDMLSDYAANETVYQREQITPDELAYIMQGILTGTFAKDGKTALNLFALFYFGITTSWRRGDIVGKTWEDVYLPDTANDDDFGTIRNRHNKTKNKSGATTTIRLTRTARAILDALKKHNADSDTIINLHNAQYYCDKIFAKVHAKYGKERMQRGTQKASCLTYHSLRGTAISHLIKAGMQESMVASMAGHAPANVERQHYIKYTPDDYRLCAEKMEAEYIHALHDDKQYWLPIFDGIMDAIRQTGNLAFDFRVDDNSRQVKMAMERLRRAGFFAALKSVSVDYKDIRLVFNHLR